MRPIAIALATAIAVLPNIRYLDDLRYRWDPVLEHSVCRSVVCSDDLLLDSAKLASQGGQSNIPVVLANLTEALQRNIVSPNRWCDLGQALRQAGRTDEARYCYSQALELGPGNAPVLWRTALFYLRINDRRNALKYMSQLLEVVPAYKDLIFGIYLVNIRNIPETLEFGIPKRSDIAQEYFWYLLKNAEMDNVKKAWEWLVRSGLADRETAGKYVDFLFTRGELSSAGKVWTIGASNDTAYLQPNQIYNGDFEMEPLRLAFDWAFHSNRSVRMQRVSTTAFSGSSSMEIEFDGSANVEFNDFGEKVLLPAGRYRFKAWVRTADLTTDQGIGFRLVDPLTPGTAVTTAILTGTHNWTPVQVDFAWSGSTRPLRIELVRHASWKFDNKIKGRAWIDAVSLIPVTPALIKLQPQARHHSSNPSD